MRNHTFVVPAYGHSRYLEDCLACLRAQTSNSRIVVSTSTPFPDLDAIAARFGADTFVHTPNRGIGHDWNIALAQSTSEWTTIAHQDDIYLPEYSGRMVAAGSATPQPLIVFSGYAERARDGRRDDVPLLRIKRRLLDLGFLGRSAIASPRAKRRTLAFGSPIPCPAVTYHREALRAFRFREDLRVALDWAAWLDLAARPGAFVWVREILMEHRIHQSSETTAGIGDGTRRREDLELLSRIWPRPIARLIVASYARIYAQVY
jgi:glycosyltransferase involved in cell wall biosynthesis